MLRKWMMSNGLWVVVKEMPHTPLVGVSLHIKGGSRVDNEKSLGIAHFLEHVFFRGTEKYPDRDSLYALIEEDGGRWNAMTAHERICCYTFVFAGSAGKTFDAISQMIFHPLFRDSDIDIERGPVIEEINKSLDDPEDCVLELYKKMAWGEHPVGRDILGTRQHIESASRPDFLDYHKKYFYPGNMVLGAAGGISAEEVFKLCFQYFGEGRRTPRMKFSGTICLSSEHIMVQEKDVVQIHTIVGTKALDWLSYGNENQKKSLSAILLFEILGGTTRLFKKVREEKGLVYTIYSVVSRFSDGGVAYTYFGSEFGKAQIALQIMLEEYDNVLMNGVAEAELKRAKLALMRNYAENSESSLSTALMFGSNELLTEDALEPSEYFQKYIEPLTLSDLMSVAPDLLRKENLSLALVGKIGDRTQEFEKVFLL